jgi:hypothetical protein
MVPLQLFFERNEEIFRSTVKRGSHPAVDAAYAEVQVGPPPYTALPDGYAPASRSLTAP